MRGMNPNPFGAFAEGIASGISGGMQNYAQMQMMKFDRDMKKAEMNFNMGAKMYGIATTPQARSAAIDIMAPALRMATGTEDFAVSGEDFDQFIGALKEDVLSGHEAAIGFMQDVTNIAKAVEKGDVPRQEGLGQIQTLAGSYTGPALSAIQEKAYTSAVGQLEKPSLEETERTKRKVAQEFTEDEIEIFRQKEEIKAGLQSSSDKVGQNWMLPDKTPVISYDGGRTYQTPGGPIPLPHNAIKVPGGATLTELNMADAKRQATEQPGGTTAPPTAPGVTSPTDAAMMGTGPYATAMAAFDAVAGGLGFDVLVGKDGFFPEVADARQWLRTAKQIGKAALMNSSRGAVWEQERIDQLFPDPEKIITNPRIEARKINSLVSILELEKAYNNQAILSATTAQEVARYRESNDEISRLIEMLSDRGGVGGGGLSAEDAALIDKWVTQ
ncbi:MAG: hypothetical protein WC277_03600 [Bacilli bacterium]